MIRLAVPGFHGHRRRLEWPFVGSVPGYLTYLQEERGLSPRTITLHGHYLRKLESYLNGKTLSHLADLSPADLTGFVMKAGAGLSQASIVGCVSAVRTFVRFAERERLVDVNLARSVDRPRIYRLARVPRSISWADVQRLLRGIDRAQAVGKRDYAILLLLVTYGLRAREVAEEVGWTDDLDGAVSAAKNDLQCEQIMLVQSHEVVGTSFQSGGKTGLSFGAGGTASRSR